MDYTDFQKADQSWTSFTSAAAAFDGACLSPGAFAAVQTAFQSTSAVVFEVIGKLGAAGRKDDGKAALAAWDAVCVCMRAAEQAVAARDSFKPPVRNGMMKGTDAATAFSASMNVCERAKSLVAESTQQQSAFRQACLGLA